MARVFQGEYIAPEKIEGVYLRSPLVAQVFVDGNSLEVRNGFPPLLNLCPLPPQGKNLLRANAL